MSVFRIILTFKAVQQFFHRAQSGNDDLTVRGESELTWERQVIVQVVMVLPKVIELYSLSISHKNIQHKE